MNKDTEVECKNSHIENLNMDVEWDQPGKGQGSNPKNLKCVLQTPRCE